MVFVAVYIVPHWRIGTIIAVLNIELNALGGKTTSFSAGGMVASSETCPFCCESVRQPPTSDVFSKDPPRLFPGFLPRELTRGSQNIVNENERPGDPGIVERRRESKFVRGRPLGRGTYLCRDQSNSGWGNCPPADRVTLRTLRLAFRNGADDGFLGLSESWHPLGKSVSELGYCGVSRLAGRLSDFLGSFLCRPLIFVAEG
jgi:hypothetical protein